MYIYTYIHTYIHTCIYIYTIIYVYEFFHTGLMGMMCSRTPLWKSLLELGAAWTMMGWIWDAVG